MKTKVQVFKAGFDKTENTSYVVLRITRNETNTEIHLPLRKQGNNPEEILVQAKIALEAFLHDVGSSDIEWFN